ncbi:MAG: STAS/SEC14 domain-containing protein [Saprospiraceae bacterium]
MNAPLSSTELLANAARLEISDFDQFVRNVLTLRAQRKGIGLPSREAILLKKVNQKSLSDAQQKRFDELAQRMGAGKITGTEHGEFMALVELSEQRDAERLENLAELAQLRGTSLRALMQKLGISPQVHG